MLETTQGLVLHTTQYSETSVITKIFTRELGVRSYIVKGVRSSKSRNKQNLFQPLSHLDLTVYNSPKKDLNFIKDMHPACQYPSLTTNPIKSSLLFFMNEVLYKTLQEQEPMHEVFDYVVDQLHQIELDEIPFSSQPQMFLLRMSTFMGIEPMNNYGLHENRFDLKEGRFVQEPVNTTLPRYQSQLLPTKESLQMHYMLAAYHGQEAPLTDNKTALRTLISYYQSHLSEFRNFKSHEILHSILS